MPTEVATVVVERNRTVQIEVPGPAYSNARVAAYLQGILTANGDLLTVASGVLARIGVGSASTGAVLTWNGSAWTAAAPASVAWNDITGKPATFPPSSHTHVASEITDFNTAWTARLTAAGSGATTGNALIWGGSSWAPGAYAYSNLSGIPATFEPSSHTHTASEITDFSTAWTTRMTALGSGASTNDVLIWNGSAWAAATPSPGFANPMTTRGDMIYASASGAPATAARRAIGPVGTQMESDGTDPIWKPQITSPTAIAATAGTAIATYNITASGSPTSYGATGLPAGLAVDTGTGAITGTPTAAGYSVVTITATGASGTATAQLGIYVAAAAGGSSGYWLPTGVVGTGISSTVYGVTDGISTYSMTCVDASSGLAFGSRFPGAAWQQLPTTVVGNVAYVTEASTSPSSSALVQGTRWRLTVPFNMDDSQHYYRLSASYRANVTTLTSGASACGLIKDNADLTLACFFIADSAGTLTKSSNFNVTTLPGVTLGFIGAAGTLDIICDGTDVIITLYDINGAVHATATFAGGAATITPSLASTEYRKVGFSFASESRSGAGANLRVGTAVAFRWVEN